MSKLLDIMTAPWAITQDMLREIGSIYLTHLRGEKIDIPSVEARLGHPLSNEQHDIAITDGVAVITAHGVIAKRMNLFMHISGGVSSEILGNQIQQALDDPAVAAIVLDIDSPGGTVDGTFELADAIYKARGEKPIVALANGLMASAAYAIGSAADAVYISGDTTHVGSIGVVASHTDYSEYEKKAGVKTTEIYAGKYKRIASQYEPLSEDGHADIQAKVDYLYSIFVQRVADFRGVAVSTVLDDMADGRVFIGQQAIDAGLVDGVATLGELIAELSHGRLPAKANMTNSILFTETEDDDMSETMKVTDITAGYIAASHPDIADHFRAEGAGNIDEQVAAARDEGASAERARIQGVLEHSMAGHEDLVNTLAFDGKTSPDAAAAQVLKAEKANKANAGADIAADAEDLAEVTAGADAGTGAEDLANLPAEDRAKAQWDASADLREEFGGKFATYLAFVKNEDKVRLRNKAS